MIQNNKAFFWKYSSKTFLKRRERMALREDLTICSLKLYKALTSGTGLQGIVDIAAELFDNQILVADMSYMVLAHSERPDTDDPMWLDIINAGFFPTDYVNAISNDKNYYRIPIADKLEIISDGISPNRFLCKILTVDGKPVGFATCVEYHSHLNDADIELFEIFCDIVGTELKGNETIINNYNRRNKSFISEMLNDSVKSDYVDERLRQVGLKVKNCNYILVAEFADEKIRRDHQIMYYSQVLEQNIPNSYCVIFRNTIVSLISNDNKELVNDAFTESVLESVKAADMICGISRCFNNIADLKAYHRQAAEAIRLGRKLFPAGRAFSYDQMSVFHMIDIIGQKEELLAFCNQKLLNILEYDKKHQTKYAQTVYAYLKFSRNPTQTAENLGIHRNTIDYRIGRVEDLFGIEFEDQSTTFSLALSLRILEYMGDFPHSAR